MLPVMEDLCSVEAKILCKQGLAIVNRLVFLQILFSYNDFQTHPIFNPEETAVA